MDSTKKWFWFWIVSMVVALYTTFVMQNLWNWFAVPALNVPRISYLMMYGLGLLAGLIFEHQDFAEEQHRDLVFAILDFCVPEDKHEALAKTIEQKTEGIWVALGFKIFGKLMSNTLGLAIGFGIHIFLS
jgi:hypothetical protein